MRVRGKLAILIATGALAVLATAPSAAAQLTITEWTGAIDGGPAGLTAGTHPGDITTTVQIGSHLNEDGNVVPDAAARNVIAELPPGFVGAPNVVPTCETVKDLIGPTLGATYCPPSAIVGLRRSRSRRFLPLLPFSFTTAIYDMRPPSGSAARFGINVASIPVLLDASVRSDSDYGIDVRVRRQSQGLGFIAATTTFWGTPGDPRHDIERCYSPGLDHLCNEEEPGDGKGIPGDINLGPNTFPFAEPSAFLSLPTACSPAGAGLPFNIFVDSWEQPSTSDSASFETESGVSGCDAVPFGPEFQIQATTDSAESPTGLEAVLALPAEGGKSPTGISQSHLKDATVTLPEGMTVNPAQANGLGSAPPPRSA